MATLLRGGGGGGSAYSYLGQGPKKDMHEHVENGRMQNKMLEKLKSSK